MIGRYIHPLILVLISLFKYVLILFSIVFVLFLTAPGVSANQPPPPRVKAPTLPPDIKACTSQYWVPQDGSYGEKPIPDGAACSVAGEGAGFCSSGICNNCKTAGYVGSIRPHLVVLALVYSPPGCTGCSSDVSQVQYQNASTVGTTLSTDQSFDQDYGLQVSGKVGAYSGKITGDYSSTDSSSTTQSISQTDQQIFKLGGNQDGINHDQDTFVVLLNPSVDVMKGQLFKPNNGKACQAAIEWETNVNGASAEIYKLTVHDLKNFSGLPPNEVLEMQKFGITADDFTAILALDPLADAGGTIDSTRYVRTAQSFPYEPPDTSQTCDHGTCTCMALSDTKISNSLTTTANTNKTSYSIGFSETAGFDLSVVSTKVTATQKFTWTASSSVANTTSDSKQASLTIPCPSIAWTRDEDYTMIEVYRDTLYGTCIFAPSGASEKVAGKKTFVAGLVKDQAGNALAREPVSVSFGGVIYKTFTDKSGQYAVYGLDAAGMAGKGKASRALVTIRGKSAAVKLGQAGGNSHVVSQ